MTSATQIAWDDMILPFQLDRPDIRGRVARLDGVLERILAQHAYPAPVADLVAEACLLTALIGQTMKLRWRLSLQARGDGPIRRIATDYFAPDEPDHPSRIRAWASFDPAAIPDLATDSFALMGNGQFAMTIDQGADMRPYQGITPLAGGALARSAEIYFAQSEQIATRFKLSAAQARVPGGPAKWRSGGVMVQHLAKPGEHVVGEATGEAGLLAAADVLSGDASEDWRRANLLLDTAETHELIGPHVSPADLLLRLFHEEAPRVFDAQPAQFGCTCSAAKVEAAMAQYSAKDLAHMTNAEGKLTADCQFCGARYEFDPRHLGFEAQR